MAVYLTLEAPSSQHRFDVTLPVEAIRSQHVDDRQRLGLWWILAGLLVGLPNRPRGLVAWLAQQAGIRRERLYRMAEQLTLELQGGIVPAPPRPLPVEQGQIDRLILTCAAWGVSVRATAEIVAEALGQRPSIGYIWRVRQAAGQKADEVFQQLVRQGALEPQTLVADELFLQGSPLLVVAEPRSLLLLYVEPNADRDSQSWGISWLELEQALGIRPHRVCADGARGLLGSPQAAGLAFPILRDHFHVLRDLWRGVGSLERQAQQAFERLRRQEEVLSQRWSEQGFESYVALDQEVRCLSQEALGLRQAAEALAEGLALVDPQTGALRDRASIEQKYDQVCAALRRLDSREAFLALQLLSRHRQTVLGYLDGWDERRKDWEQQVREVVTDEDVAEIFLLVAPAWWQQQQAQWAGRCPASHTLRRLNEYLQECYALCPSLQALSQALGALLEGQVRASSAVEALHSVLDRRLRVIQGFPTIRGQRNYLHLFRLWWAMHRYERGKRRGRTPFELAGVAVPTTDWLELLGYPKAA